MDLINKMKHIYPKYYKDFKCIANKCPDSCCKDWDVELDDNAEKYYNTVQGEFGDKIRSLTVDGEDNNRIFISREDGRCPFWNDDMLCDIYINLGEEHLCETCANFPRITQDYVTFTEHMLSFACPVASRLILDSDKPYDDFNQSEFDTDGVEYSVEYMEFLLKARTQTAKILTDKSKSFTARLKEAIIFNSEIQDRIDSDEYSLDDISVNLSDENTEKADCKFIFDLHQSLEIISGKWRSLIETASETCNNCKVSPEYDDDYEKLALYYAYVYYLKAIDTYNVMLPFQRLVCAYIIISRVENCLRGDGNYDKNRLSRIMQKYSKEVEHSYENSDILEFEFETKIDYWAENLVTLL